jgi:hypothetical protein
MMIKIKEYAVSQRGDRGTMMTIPKVYVDDNRLQIGDRLEVYRTNLEDGRDALIVVPKNSAPQSAEINLAS